MYLLDTNVISELRLCAKGEGNANVMNWAKGCPEGKFFTSAVVFMEIKKGILQIQRKDKQQAGILQNWFDNTLKTTFNGKVFPIDEKTAEICASLHIPDPAPINDAWIASTAIQHNLALVTRNVNDFKIRGLRVFNPFD